MDRIHFKVLAWLFFVIAGLLFIYVQIPSLSSDRRRQASETRFEVQLIAWAAGFFICGLVFWRLSGNWSFR